MRKVYILFNEDIINGVFFNFDSAVNRAIEWYEEDLREWFEYEQKEEAEKLEKGLVSVTPVNDFRKFVEHELWNGDIYYVVEKYVDDDDEEA